MTELVLVRHGETVWHAENRYAGRSDVDLTDRGHRQAEALAGWAVDAGLDAVLTSTMRRAVDSAAPAARAAGLELEADPRLVEVDFGAGEGLTRDEMQARFPEALASFLRTPASTPMPGGETGADAVARASPVLAGRTGRVLVVGHQTLLRLLLCSWLGLPLDAYRTAFPRLDNAARTEVRLGPGSTASLLTFNVSICD